MNRSHARILIPLAALPLAVALAAHESGAQNRNAQHGHAQTGHHPTEEGHPATPGQTGSAGLSGPELLDPNNAPATLQVALPDLASGVIPQDNAFNGMGCTGQNRSLHVRWSNAPAGTRSFMLIVHDPDAPTGVGFFHWTVYNLPATATELATDASHTGLPQGATQGYTDFAAQGYGGPCPPPGENHRYIVTVYALDLPTLSVPNNPTGAMLRFMARGHTLALGRATGTYRRP